MPDPGSNAEQGASGAWFQPTSWTLICAARDTDSPRRREALEQLCRIYWYPLYAYVRRHGHRPEDAEDLTQSFFQHLLERNFLGAVDRRKGKFRSFLLASLRYFLINEREFRQAAKRGGDRPILSLDQCMEDHFAAEPASGEVPELLFDRDWARTLLLQVHSRLREEYRRTHKSELFDQLARFLGDESTMTDYRTLASSLDMSANAVAVAVSRLRKRYRDLLREEISQTVATAEDAAREIDYLFEIIGSLN